jgi:hypothetical protein
MSSSPESLSNRFEMRGDLIGYNLGQDAVFRLSSN